MTIIIFYWRYVYSVFDSDESHEDDYREWCSNIRCDRFYSFILIQDITIAFKHI